MERKCIAGIGGFAALVLALLIALACLPVFAQAAPADVPGTGSITVGNLKAGDQVTLYKVAGVQVDSATNETTVTALGTGDAKAAVEAYIASAGDTENGTAEAAKTLGGYVPGDFTAAGNATATGNSVTISGLGAGLYYVAVVNADDATTVYQPTVVALKPVIQNGAYTTDGQTGSADLKKSEVPLNKTTTDNGQAAKSTDDYGVGQKVPFTITSTTPVYTANAENRVFTFTDTLSAGLTYDENSLEVKVNGQTVTAGADTYTFTPEGQKLTVAFANAFLTTAENAGKSVEITYTATVNDSAVVKTGDKNSVTLEFSRDSNSTETSTPGDEVTVAYYGIKVLKQDNSNPAKPLAGAVFEVKDANGKVVATLTTKDDGTAKTTAPLGEGTYKLHETKAPAGYSLAATDKEITLKADTVETSATSDDFHYAAETVTDTPSVIQLPGTGDRGTFLITLVGAAAVVIGVVAITRSRARKHE